MSKDWFRSNVSRETLERLEIYDTLLRKWNPKINLVSRTTLDDLWTRHFLDSWQVLDIAGPAECWADLGTGGGFPGLLVAVSGQSQETVLVEADRRKSAFLQTVLRETGAEARVISERIEQVDPLKATVLSARALAGLTDLLSMAERHLAEGGMAVFPKGARWQQEISEAERQWRFSWEAVPSKTDPEAVVLKIGDLERV